VLAAEKIDMAFRIANVSVEWTAMMCAVQQADYSKSQ